MFAHLLFMKKFLFLLLLLLLCQSACAYEYDIEKMNAVYAITEMDIEELFLEDGKPGEDLHEFINVVNNRIDELKSEGKTQHIPQPVMDITRNGRANFTIVFKSGKEFTFGIVAENHKIVQMKEGGVERAMFSISVGEDTVAKLIYADNPLEAVAASFSDPEVKIEGIGVENRIKEFYVKAILNPLIIVAIIAAAIATIAAVLKLRSYLHYRRMNA